LPTFERMAPTLQRLAKDYPGVKTVTVAIWQDRQPTPTAIDFVEQYGITQATAVDDSRETLAKGFGVEGTPTVYAVDPSGKIIAAHPGELGDAGYRAFYERLSKKV
jgi:thioredoxin-related protein